MSAKSSGIVHIVLFKWKETATADQIGAALTALRGLKGQIPGITELSCGANFTDRGQGFTHGLVVHLTDKAALEAYGPNPTHQEVVVNHIKPIAENVLALDYEV